MIHVVTAFSRYHLLDELIRHYHMMSIVWHPIIFEDEKNNFQESWIKPFVIERPERNFDGVFDVGYYKKNAFIQKALINDDDYYIILDDDDGIEPDVFDTVRTMDDDVIFISMKRGHNIPKDVPPARQYETSTLYAIPENIRIGAVGQQQYIMKGKIFKQLNFDESFHCSDGTVAVWLKEHFTVRYETDLYALFNYFEPGRWNKVTDVGFGVLINDAYRFNSVLRKSELPGNLHYVINPESATKGLNTLLDVMEKEGAKIAILVHQDMYFRKGWFAQVQDKLSQLPDTWVCAGIVGKDMEGRICGRLHDMRIVDNIDTISVHEFPQPAACFDECVIIINLKKGFRFDESLDGFDLYGTLCVLQTWEMGGTAWIIDAFAEHYCMRPFSWFPDEDFKQRYKMLYDRFNKKYGVVDSTVFVSKPRFETSAAPEGKAA